MLNSLGANLSPKGKLVSMNMCWSHLIDSGWRSAGWTGTRRKALLMSILARRVPSPICLIWLMAESTVMYFTQHNSLGIPLLILPLVGLDRSTISLHLFGRWLLSMTLKRLTWACGTRNIRNGPATRPAEISSVKYVALNCICVLKCRTQIPFGRLQWLKLLLEPNSKPIGYPINKKVY